MNQKIITKEQLEELYIKQNLSINEISTINKISRNSIIRMLKKFNIIKNDTQIKISRERLSLKKYGTKHPMQNPKVYQKVKDTCIKKYGGNSSLADTRIRDKGKVTCLEKYGKNSYSQTEEYYKKFKETSLRKYGTEHPMQNETVKNKLKNTYIKENVREKVIATKKLNETYNTSKPEEEAYKLLLEHFSKEDIIRQYTNKLYPFSCDFYIKSLDLYIEYQGTWCHGRQPYNLENNIHRKIVEKWKRKETEYFDYAIKVWTEKDPKKRRIAKENNLNWKEFFNLEDLKEWLQNIPK